jgi:hypothetical protein
MAAPVTERADASAPATPPHFRQASWIFALSLALAVGGLVRAETLVDPTRSPLGNRIGEGAAPENEAAPLPATRLQMIFRGPGETRTAVIDGNDVRVGDSVRLRGGTARVERITDTSVVLARGDGRETLQLFPGVERSIQCARKPDSQRPGGC